MNYDINMTTKSSFWVEKLTKYHLKKTKKPKTSANLAEIRGFKSIREYNSDIQLDTLKPRNRENNMTMKTSFWDKLTHVQPSDAKRA